MSVSRQINVAFGAINEKEIKTSTTTPQWLQQDRETSQYVALFFPNDVFWSSFNITSSTTVYTTDGSPLCGLYRILRNFSFSAFSTIVAILLDLIPLWQTSTLVSSRRHFRYDSFDRTTLYFACCTLPGSSCHISWPWPSLVGQCSFSVLYQYIVTVVVPRCLEQRSREVRSAAPGFGIGKTTSECKRVKQFMLKGIWRWWKALGGLNYFVTGTLLCRENNVRQQCLWSCSRCESVNRRISWTRLRKIRCSSYTVWISQSALHRPSVLLCLVLKWLYVVKVACS